MDRLNEHLEHIRAEVVPRRGAAQDGMDEGYLREVEGRAQPPHLARGLEQWNAGRFYEQHETLEWLWRATDEPVRDALKGIIQSGVGAYHVLKRNRRGALGKWTGAIGYLEPFEGRHPYGIDVGHLRGQVLAARQALLEDEEPEWEVHRTRVEGLRVRWERREAEPRVTALLRRLDRAWSESPLSVEANCADLTEEEAGWLPEGGARPIRSLLVHLGVGKAVTANRCFGDGQLGFQEVRAPETWRLLRRWLTEEHEAIREPLGFLRDAALDETREMFGRSMALERIIEASIEHDLYHAGEINLLRELYRKSKK
jgi:predicted metal-dependent hydrolase/uncharacterized damage-inducible protein DinB